MDQHFHTEKIGKMVEDLEGTLRSQIEEVYFKKSQEVIKCYLYQVIDTSRFSPVLGKPNIDNANKLRDIYTEGEKNKQEK